MIVVVEFSGRCRGNPVKVSRILRMGGGRIVSYDPGTGVLMGTLKVNVLDPADLERKARLLTESMRKDIDDCRFWVKVVLSVEQALSLYKKSVMKTSSNSSEAVIVRLGNYAYSLWRQRRASTAKLVPISRSDQWYPGAITELVRPCDELPELLSEIREDLAGSMGSEG